MKINLPASLPNSATGEIPAKPADASEDGTASTFFMQMSQIQNQQVTTDDAVPAQACSAETAGGDTSASAMDASLFNITPVNTTPVQISLPVPELPSASADEAGVPAPGIGVSSTIAGNGSMPIFVTNRESVKTDLNSQTASFSELFPHFGRDSSRTKSQAAETMRTRVPQAGNAGESSIPAQPVTQPNLPLQYGQTDEWTTSVINKGFSGRAPSFEEMSKRTDSGISKAAESGVPQIPDSGSEDSLSADLPQIILKAALQVRPTKEEGTAINSDTSANTPGKPELRKIVESERRLSVNLERTPADAPERIIAAAATGEIDRKSWPKSNTVALPQSAEAYRIPAAESNVFSEHLSNLPPRRIDPNSVAIPNGIAADSIRTDQESGTGELWRMGQNRVGTITQEPGRVAGASDPAKDISYQASPSLMRFAESRNTVAQPSSPTPGVPPKDLIFQVAERIQIQLREGKGEIRIQLQPDSLGRLEIKAENTVHGVVARIIAESSSVKTYLENNLHMLQQNMQDQGLKIDRIQVTIQDGSDLNSSTGGHTAQFGQAGSGRHEREPQRSHPEIGTLVPDVPEDLQVDPVTLTVLRAAARFYTVA